MQSLSFPRNLISNRFLLKCVSPKRYIFCYHDVSTPGAPAHSPLYSTYPDRFIEQIEFLSTFFEWKTLDEIVRPGIQKKHQAALTFDDGYRSVKEIVFPYLRKKGIPFTVFVCKQAVEKDLLHGNPPQSERIYLDEDDIRLLIENGIGIGSHSTSHAVLSECDDKQLEEEIQSNMSFLKDRFNLGKDHFAIPFGKKNHYNAEVLSRLYERGIKYVYTTNPVFVETDKLDNSAALIPRISIINESPREILFYLNRPILKQIDI